MKKELQYTLILTAIYFVVSWTGMLHHEIWFDEAQAWLIARDSSSISDLLQNLQYEGHPLLWHLLLFIITKFTSDPFWMQVLHVFLATVTVFIFLKNAPFRWLFKILFIFGYFMVFEYSILSRNYMLGVLFLFWACSNYSRRKEKFITISLLLTAAVNVHLFFAVPALLFFVLLAYEQFSKGNFFPKSAFIFGNLILLVGFLFFVYQLIPPGDSLFFHKEMPVSLYERLSQSSSFLVKGILPLPDFSLEHFWNSNLLINQSKPIALFFTLVLLFLPGILFYKNLRILTFVYVSFFGLFVLFFLTQISATRHCGVAFFVLIIALWLNENAENQKNKLQQIITRLQLHRLKNPILYFILIVQLIAGIHAYASDWNRPFSTSNDLAGYLKSNTLNQKEIAVISFEGIPLSALLQKKVHFLTENGNKSFFNYKYDHKINRTQGEIIALLENYKMPQHHMVLVSYLNLTSYNKPIMWTKINNGLAIRHLQSFENAIFEGSNVYVYEIVKF